MIKIKPIESYDLLERFGEPGESDNIITKPFPFPLYLNGNKHYQCNNFYGHIYIADAVIDAYSEILDVYGLEFIRENGLDEYGGCYNYRKARGANKLSIHSWGLALDILPSMGKMGEPSLIPYDYADAFIKRGFMWGNWWEHRDSMHITAVKE